MNEIHQDVDDDDREGENDHMERIWERIIENDREGVNDDWEGICIDDDRAGENDDMERIWERIIENDREGVNDDMERIIENGGVGSANAAEAAVGGQQPEAEEQLLLESFEHHLEHDLRSRNDPFFLSFLNFTEAKERVQSEKSYQERIIQAAMQNDDATPAKKAAKKARDHFLQTLKDETMDIYTSNGHTIPSIPLPKMADKCDAIYRMISSNAESGNDGKQEKDDDNNKDDSKSSSSQTTISLKDYDMSSVDFFLCAVFGVKPTYVSFNRIIEGVEIAHYLQCKDVLEYLVSYMLEPGFITTDNCSFLVGFSDHYELPRLFESALGHAMNCLGNLQNIDIWEEFTPELRQRIQQMQIAVRTSIHQNPTRQHSKKLYFSSITEYLAIFAENVQYHRERLEVARHEQEQLLERYHNADNETDIRQSRGYQYAAEKIAKQEQRVRTFEAVMKEQKKLFSSSHYHHQEREREA